MAQARKLAPTRMLVTDLDGTLTRTGGKINESDIELLRSLEGSDTLRVVATGRTLHSARNLLPDDFPIDYLVFSSGAGVMEWGAHELLLSHSLTAEELTRAVAVCVAEDLDFMIHRAVPENHHFLYRESGSRNPDFQLRRDRQAKFATRWDGRLDGQEASQVLVVSPGDHDNLHRRLQTSLATLNVIRATSPLDGRTAWFEIFSRRVSKAIGASWLAERYGLTAACVLGVGNDYNDYDLLRWAGARYVLGNAPAALLSEFENMPTNDEGGFASAVKRWLESR